MGGNQSVEKKEEQPILWRKEYDTSLECWSEKEFNSWLLHCTTIDPQKKGVVLKILKKYCIDGELIFPLNEVFTLEKNEPMIDDVKAIDEKTYSLLKSNLFELVENYESLFPNKPAPAIPFPPHEIPKFLRDDFSTRINTIMFYHVMTEHHEKSGSRTISRTWADQPKQLRYLGSPVIRLQVCDRKKDSVAYQSLFTQKNTLRPRSHFETISHLFFYGLSLTGHKADGRNIMSPRASTSKRVNPSSGGLHPTESYLISSQLSGVFHYSPRYHALELRKQIKEDDFNLFVKTLSPNVKNPSEIIFVSFASVVWREVWKYGERAYRYSLLDIGHAVCSIRISAARIGLNAQIVTNFPRDFLETMIGVDQPIGVVHNIEKQHGLLLLALYPAGSDFQISEKYAIPQLGEVINQIFGSNFIGYPTQLSKTHVHWEIIRETIDASRVLSTDFIPPIKYSPVQSDSNLLNLNFPSTKISDSETVIRTRRSAVDFIGAPITIEQFKQVLMPVVPQFSQVPHDVFYSVNAPLVNLFINVYNVTNMQSGLYILVRNPSSLSSLQQRCTNFTFEWTLVESLSPLPIYFLRAFPDLEMAQISCHMSCDQNIAKQGAFSFGLVGDFKSGFSELGPSGYEYLHYEAANIGHLVYLQCTSLGIAATGMGCYTDDVAEYFFGFGIDPVELENSAFKRDENLALQMQNATFRSLYHLAVGVPFKDDRYPSFNYEEDLFDTDLKEYL